MISIEQYQLIEKSEVSWVKARAILPRGAEILSFQEFNDNIHVWAIVDTDEDNIERIFYIYREGLFFVPKRGAKKMKFLGTCVFPRLNGKQPGAKHIFEMV